VHELVVGRSFAADDRGAPGPTGVEQLARIRADGTVDDVLCGTLGPTTESPNHEFTATVVRMEPGSNMLACKFIDMSSECFNFLEKLLRRPEGARDAEQSVGGKS